MQHITFKNKGGFSKKMKTNWKESVLIFNQKWREGGVLSPFLSFFKYPLHAIFPKPKIKNFWERKNLMYTKTSTIANSGLTFWFLDKPYCSLPWPPCWPTLPLYSMNRNLMALTLPQLSIGRIPASASSDIHCYKPNMTSWKAKPNLLKWILKRIPNPTRNFFFYVFNFKTVQI